MTVPIVKKAGFQRGGVAPTMVKWSAAESHHQSELIEDLMTRMGVFTISKLQGACEQKFGRRPSASRVNKLIKAIQARWATEDAENRPSIKAQSIRRVYDHIRRARGHEGRPGQGTPGQPGYVAPVSPSAPKWSAIARFEELLADFQGTREPLRVSLEVQMTEALMNVIASMTPEQVHAALEEEKERDRLVEIGKRALTAGSGVVVTQANTNGHTNGNGRGSA